MLNKTQTEISNQINTLLPKLRHGALGLLAGSSILAGNSALAANSSPNIVFILADDLGWTDINCRTDAFESYIANPSDNSWKYDSTYYQTPNIARLRAAGMRFTQAYSACPVCIPTRACIMTGKYPSRFQKTGIAPEIDRQYRSEDRLVSAFNRPQLPHKEMTIAEALKPNGPSGPNDYLSCFIGKWHLAHSPAKKKNYCLSYPSHDSYAPGVPENGFDFSIHSHSIRRIDGEYWEHAGQQYPYCYDLKGLPGMAGDFFDRTTLWGDPDRDDPKEYLTDSYTTKAEQFLECVADPNGSLYGRPFFLYLSHEAPHTPIQAKENYRAYFEATLGKPKKHSNPAYAAMIKSLDDSVGRIVHKLKQLNIYENTVIVFTSDNGGHVPHTNNSPLRGGKGEIYEGGIRVPMIVSWPGHIKPNSTCSVPVFSADFLPTFLEIAGIEISRLNETYPGFDHTAIDGQGLVPLFEDRPFTRLNEPGEPADDNAIFWHYPLAGNPVSAALCNGYKLIKSYADTVYNWSDSTHFDHSREQLDYNAPGTFELYNLADNIEEDPSKNLYTDKQSEPFYKESQHLKNLVEKWLANINAGMLRPSVRIRNRLYRKIQDAIDSAVDGDEIIVYPGVHLGAIKFGNKNITLRSVNPDDPQVVADTVIHGSHTGTVVTFGGNETSECSLRGLTISGGTMPSAHWRFDESTGTTAYDTIQNKQAILYGPHRTTGAIDGALSFDGKDDYVDCGNTISLNPQWSSFSFSLWVNFASFDRDMVLLSKRKDNNNFIELLYKSDDSSAGTGFLDVSAKANGITLVRLQTGMIRFISPKTPTHQWIHVAIVANRTHKRGGHVYLNGRPVPAKTNKLNPWNYLLAPEANLIIANSTSGSMPFHGKIDDFLIFLWALTPDQVKTLAAGQLLNGGGINGNNTRATIDRCIIRVNSAYEGGGLHKCNGLISNCSIVDNSSARFGGGLAHCSGTIVNCVIADNNARKSGGGIYNSHNGSITNCTIAYNLANVGPGLKNSSSSVTNSIIWGNSTLHSKSPSPQLDNCADPHYSCIQYWTSRGKFNISTNPCFVNSPQSFDITISSSDPFSFFTIKVNDPDLYGLANIIELDNDGVLRTITHHTTPARAHDEVRFVPPLSPPSKARIIIRKYCKNTRSVIEDYHLNPDSPCIDKCPVAITPLLLNLDIDGEPRVQGPAVDMGADEAPAYLLSPVQSPPTTSSSPFLLLGLIPAALAILLFHLVKKKGS
jgi:arylsulfatase A-like enzyme